MARVKNLKGGLFGRLTVKELRPDRAKNGGAVWICDCSCGSKKIEVTSDHLQSGYVLSCGCIVGERQIKAYKAAAQASTNMVVKKECVCKRIFEVSYPERDNFLKKRALSRKLCDTCKIKKSVGTRPSKHDW